MLSRSPSALAVIFMPGADLSCAREMKLSSALKSGLNENESIKLARVAIIANKMAPPTSLHNRERFMCLLYIRSVDAAGTKDQFIVRRVKLFTSFAGLAEPMRVPDLYQSAASRISFAIVSGCDISET